MEKKITTVREPARDIPVRASADILIVGGGPAGLMAAQAAAGEGLKVMLIESRGYLGGNLTIGLPILGFLGQKGNQIIVRATPTWPSVPASSAAKAMPRAACSPRR